MEHLEWVAEFKLEISKMTITRMIGLTQSAKKQRERLLRLVSQERRVTLRSRRPGAAPSLSMARDAG